MDQLAAARHATLFEINARVWAKEQPWWAACQDLAQIPDAQIDAWAALGIDWIWMMGVWEPSPKSVEVCTAPPAKDLMDHCWKLVPKAMPEAMVGSPYAIRNYRLNRALGLPMAAGEKGSLARLKERLNLRGIRLMLDFVPNHTAQDHPWTTSHPERYVRGNAAELRKHPEAFFETAKGDAIAMAKDPLFPPWSDTAQINYRHPSAIEGMQGTLLEIAKQCDGVRCDMAMLVINEVFDRTWGGRASGAGTLEAPPEFWEKTIPLVREAHPGFTFLAEVYWDLEWRLQRMGFDFVYDKRLYDRLVGGDSDGVRDHLALASLDFQNGLARFVENHDEPRAQEALARRHRAAAVVSAAVPGMWFMHEGQWEGRRVKVPVQLDARPEEPVNEALRHWYERLLTELKNEPWKTGALRMLHVQQWGTEIPTADGIVAIYRRRGEARGLAVANIGTEEARGTIVFPPGDLPGAGTVWFRDALSGFELGQRGATGAHAGLGIDLAPGEAHLFRIEV